MAVNCFGSGVAGLSVHASTHTPPIVDFWMERKNALFTHADFSSSLHELLNTHAMKFHVLPAVCSSTGKNGAVFPHAGPPLSVLFLTGSDCFLTHRNFPGFQLIQQAESCAFSPTISWKEPFTSSAVCSPYRPVWLCNFRHFNAEIGTIVLPPMFTV